MVEGTYIFDCEVFAHDWLFVFKEVATGEYTVIWNDNDEVLAFMERNPYLGGFNNKHYDNHILKAVMCGFTPEQVKEINDLIIVHELNGWDIPALREYRVYFDSFDLKDDCQDGVSLKGIEAHLGIPIEETEVDFNVDHVLSESEKAQTTYYCKYDVDATEILFKLRQGYLDNKVAVGRKRGLTDRQAMYMTNAKLTSVYLQAQKPEKPWTDERDYQYPDKLLRQYIPQEVFDFFDKLHDPNIPNYLLFGGYDEQGVKHKGAALDFSIGECKCTIAYGGIHGAIPTYVEEATEGRSIRNKDVASYYPHLMTIPLSKGQKYGFCSRNIPSPQVYVDTLEERVQAKKAGDKVTANALKLVLNTTYGTMLNGKDGVAFNDLYDPLMGRSVCITGQLHKRTYEYLGEMKASTNPIMYCEGGVYGGHLKPSDKIKPLLKPMTASFGITALNELQRLYNGKSIAEDGEFALEVMQHINQKVTEFKNEDGWLYAIYGTPAESLCGLQIEQFRKKYGIIENVSDRPYVSNSFHCHVTEDLTPIEKQNLEGRFWDMFNGGKIQYVRYPISYNREAVKTLVRRAMQLGFYEGVNLSLAYCDDCGHQELEMDVCPVCGSTNLTKIDRMNGYLSYSRVHGDTRLNAAKMAEIAERRSM